MGPSLPVQQMRISRYTETSKRKTLLGPDWPCPLDQSKPSNPLKLFFREQQQKPFSPFCLNKPRALDGQWKEEAILLLHTF